MGPKEEDGVLVGRRFDSSFWKLINLKDRERETVSLLHIYHTPPNANTSDTHEMISVSLK